MELDVTPDTTSTTATTTVATVPPKHPDTVKAEERGDTVKEIIFLTEQLQAVEALLEPLQELNRVRMSMSTTTQQVEAARAVFDKALKHPHVPAELAQKVRGCGRDTELILITLNCWIEPHWVKLLRVLGVLVGKPGAVVTIFPHELLLPYAKALDYIVKRGKIAIGDVVLALKPPTTTP